MKHLLSHAILFCVLVTGCGPRDPGAHWQVYEPTRTAEQTQRIQVLTYTVGKERAVPSFRVLLPDGTQWQMEGDQTSWRAIKIDPDGYTTEIPMKKVAEGASLGGASWWTVDRRAAETQAATTQPMLQAIDEQHALAIARQAVETHDGWGDRATYEVSRIYEGWSVVAWHLPRTTGDYRLILMDGTGKVLRYSRGHKASHP